MSNLKTIIQTLEKDPFYKFGLNKVIESGMTTEQNAELVLKIKIEEGLKFDETKKFYRVLILGQDIGNISKYKKDFHIIKVEDKIKYIINQDESQKIVELMGKNEKKREYRFVIYELFEKEQEILAKRKKNIQGLANERRDQGRYEKCHLQFLNELGINVPFFMHYSENKSDPRNYRIAYRFVNGIRGDKLFWVLSHNKNKNIASQTEKIYDKILELLSNIYYYGTKNIEKQKKKNMMRRIQPLTVENFFESFMNIFAYVNKIGTNTKEFQKAYSQILPEFKKIFEPVVKGYNLDLCDEDNYFYTPGDMGPHNMVIDLEKDKIFWIDVGHAKEQPWQWDFPKSFLSYVQGDFASLKNCFQASYNVVSRMNNVIAYKNPNNPSFHQIKDFSELDEKEKQKHHGLLKKGIFKYLLNIMSIGIQHQNEFPESYNKLLSLSDYIYYQGEKYLIDLNEMYNNKQSIKFYRKLLREHLENIISTLSNPNEFRSFEIDAYPLVYDMFNRYNINNLS